MAFALIMMAMVIGKLCARRPSGNILTTSTVLPESPRWLINQGYDSEAKEVLQWITPRKNLSPNELNGKVDALYTSIVNTRELEKDAEGDFSYMELLHGGKAQNWRRMALCLGIMAFQQLSG